MGLGLKVKVYVVFVMVISLSLAAEDDLKKKYKVGAYTPQPLDAESGFRMYFIIDKVVKDSKHDLATKVFEHLRLRMKPVDYRTQVVSGILHAIVLQDVVDKIYYCLKIVEGINKDAKVIGSATGDNLEVVYQKCQIPKPEPIPAEDI